MRKLYLVACSKQKQPCGLHIAADLYISPWFKAARAYVEQQLKIDNSSGLDDWAILSAKYGLLWPKTEIRPYEQSLQGADDGARADWLIRVIDALRANYEGEFKQMEFEFLAGLDYRKPLEDWLLYQGATIARPLLGLGIGQQKAWLKKHTERAHA